MSRGLRGCSAQLAHPGFLTAAGNAAIYAPFPQRILPMTQFMVRHRGEETGAIQ